MLGEHVKHSRLAAQSPLTFSARKGAAAATEAMLQMLPRRLAALGFFSGSLMCRRRWLECARTPGGAAALAELPMLQGHGRSDFCLGVNGARWMHSLCVEELAMRRAEYVESDGGHTVPADLASRFIAMAAEPGAFQRTLQLT